MVSQTDAVPIHLHSQADFEQVLGLGTGGFVAAGEWRATAVCIWFEPRKPKIVFCCYQAPHEYWLDLLGLIPRHNVSTGLTVGCLTVAFCKVMPLKLSLTGFNHVEITDVDMSAIIQLRKDIYMP